MPSLQTEVKLVEFPNCLNRDSASTLRLVEEATKMLLVSGKQVGRFASEGGTEDCKVLRRQVQDEGRLCRGVDKLCFGNELAQVIDSGWLLYLEVDPRLCDRQPRSQKRKRSASMEVEQQSGQTARVVDRSEEDVCVEEDTETQLDLAFFFSMAFRFFGSI